MSKKQKLIARLKQRPRDFAWSELIALLHYFGFGQEPTGSTGGSRRCFRNNEGIPIWFHEPHPSKVLKPYMIKQLINLLEKEGLI